MVLGKSYYFMWRGLFRTVSGWCGSIFFFSVALAFHEHCPRLHQQIFCPNNFRTKTITAPLSHTPFWSNIIIHYTQSQADVEWITKTMLYNATQIHQNNFAARTGLGDSVLGQHFLFMVTSNHFCKSNRAGPELESISSEFAVLQASL